MQDYLQKYGTAIESWYPFGGRGNTQKILGNSTIIELKKTPAHIAEKFNVFDFEISADDMNKIAALNKNQRFKNW